MPRPSNAQPRNLAVRTFWYWFSRSINSGGMTGTLVVVMAAGR